MVCSDTCVGTPCKTAKDTEDRLSALPPSLRKHFLESLSYNKELLEELASM